jgi:lysozyme family protein
MAQFSKSYKLLTDAEFASNPKKFLHKNKTETHLTLGGIYERYHSLATNWQFVHSILDICEGSLERASVMLYNDDKTYSEVAEFFEKEFWLPMKLDEIQSQKVADEIFLSGVHIGKRNAIKLAQELVGAKTDGFIGNITIKCLNNYDERVFDKMFDKLEIDNYELMIEQNEKLAFYRDGFINRATIV